LDSLSPKIPQVLRPLEKSDETFPMTVALVVL